MFGGLSQDNWPGKDHQDDHDDDYDSGDSYIDDDSGLYHISLSQLLYHPHHLYHINSHIPSPICTQLRLYHHH